MTVLEQAFYQASKHLLKSLSESKIFPNNSFEDGPGLIAKLAQLNAEIMTLKNLILEFEDQADAFRKAHDKNEP
jgi:hypothetical protein